MLSLCKMVCVRRSRRGIGQRTHPYTHFTALARTGPSETEQVADSATRQ